MPNVKKLAQLYAFISQVNQNIVRVKDEATLFVNACKIAIEFGKFKIAWIGMFDEATRKIKLVEQAGIALGDIKFFTGNDSVMSSPQNHLLNTGKCYICNDISKGASLGNWEKFIARHGIYSCIILPITKSGIIVGSFNLYAETSFVDQEEIGLMEEVTNDISFALEFFEKARRQKEVEDLLVSNEKRFRAMIESGRDMIALISYQGKILYGSSTITKKLGYKQADFLNMPCLNFIHPDNIIGLVSKRNEILHNPGKAAYDQLRVRHSNGNWIWCELTITNLLRESGVRAFVCNFRDISEKKELEKQKDYAWNNLNALINNTHDMMWSVDRNYNLITSNKAFDEIIQLMSHKTIHKGDSVLTEGFSEERLTKYKALYKRAFAGETFTEEEYSDTPVEFWTEISYYPIREGNHVIGTACHSRNVTERKLAGLEQLKTTSELVRRNQDLEQFSYIVSHDLRAPLTNIIGAVALLNEVKLTAHDKEILEDGLNKSAENLDNVIKDLNHIIGVRQPGNERKEWVSFSGLVENITLSIGNLLRKDDIEIKYDFSKADSIFTIKSYLYSIFFNLIHNSIKYRRQEVPLIIDIKSTVTDNITEILFSDNGMGIDLKRNGKHVFGLYKRFHPEIEGKGMGLFMIKTQIETLGGKISMVSEVNAGTEIKLELHQ